MSSSRVDRGRGGSSDIFLSAHRCPEVDLLPRHDSNASPRSQQKVNQVTCAGESQVDYLNVSHSEEEEEEEEEEEGSESDWSEEDLSLHFSPSVILQSEDEASDPESSFRCVDVTVETQATGQEGAGLKMVPKRQIQLKKKKQMENFNNQVTQAPVEGGGAYSVRSANELCSTVHSRSDVFLRQHSVPASFHTQSSDSGDVDNYRVYRGLVSGAHQGFQVGGDSPRRLQKSLSLDETKTKMASCIIKSVLSKKMQVEQMNTRTSHLKTNAKESSAARPPVEQQRGGASPVEQQRAWEGGAPGVSKAPVHVVRDMKSLVKNTYNLSFATATTSDDKPTSFKLIGQDSPPPTYQQAVEVKGHQKVKSSRGHVAKVAASFSQSQARQQCNTSSRPITREQRGNEPIAKGGRVNDVTWPVTAKDTPPSITATASQSERIKGVRGEAPPPSSHTGSQQEQRGVSCQSDSSHTRVFTQSTLHPHMKVNYKPRPLNYVHTPSAPTLHLLERSEENTSEQPDCSRRPRPPQPARMTRDQEGHDITVTPPTQTSEHQEQQHVQNIPCSLRGFLPAQVGGDFLVAGAALPPGAFLSGPAPCHVMFEPQSGRCYYVDSPPQHQRKMLLDPETGQFFQVLLPTASPASSTNLFPMCCVNSAPTVINPPPTMLQTSSANPTVLSVMQFQPMAPSLYGAPCLPFTLFTPSTNFTLTSPR